MGVQPSTNFVDLIDSIATEVGGVLGNNVKKGLGDEDIISDEKFDRRFNWGS